MSIYLISYAELGREMMQSSICICVTKMAGNAAVTMVKIPQWQPCDHDLHIVSFYFENLSTSCCIISNSKNLRISEDVKSLWNIRYVKYQGNSSCFEFCISRPCILDQVSITVNHVCHVRMIISAWIPLRALIAVCGARCSPSVYWPAIYLQKNYLELPCSPTSEVIHLWPEVLIQNSEGNRVKPRSLYKWNVLRQRYRLRK